MTMTRNLFHLPSSCNKLTALLTPGTSVILVLNDLIDIMMVVEDAEIPNKKQVNSKRHYFWYYSTDHYRKSKDILSEENENMAQEKDGNLPQEITDVLTKFDEKLSNVEQTFEPLFQVPMFDLRENVRLIFHSQDLFSLNYRSPWNCL